MKYVREEILQIDERVEPAFNKGIVMIFDGDIGDLALPHLSERLYTQKPDRSIACPRGWAQVIGCSGSQNGNSG
jgi:hypothetical protein